MSRNAVNDVPSIGKVLGPYSRAVWAGNLLYLSGQLGIDPATGKLDEGGAAAETQQLMKGLSAVLSAAGLSMGDVVKANVFLTSIDVFAAMNKVYESFFEAPYRGALSRAHNRRRGRASERRPRRDRAGSGRPRRLRMSSRGP
jgi:2-iminobutanoate/2-iminopropanoate deaminase